MSYSDQPPPPPPYGNNPYGTQPPLGTNQKAVWSLVSGILGLVCCGVVSIVALFLSNSAKKDIARTGQAGAGLATAGMVLGWIGVAFLAINLILLATGNYYFEFNN